MTLGNNHVFDDGPEGIAETLDHLDASPVTAIGAGRSAVDAARPLLVSAASDPEGGILLIAGFAWRRSMAERFQAYAHADRAGCNPVDAGTVAAIGAARARWPRRLIVVVPHWQRDYRWASPRQRTFAAESLAAGADLVIGHGAHMLQQVERFPATPTGGLAVHGLGNFIFNAPGRYARYKVPPISAVARLALTGAGATLRLYPFISDNRLTGYRPRFLTSREAAGLADQMRQVGFLPADAVLADEGIAPHFAFALPHAAADPPSAGSRRVQ